MAVRNTAALPFHRLFASSTQVDTLTQKQDQRIGKAHSQRNIFQSKSFLFMVPRKREKDGTYWTCTSLSCQNKPYKGMFSTCDRLKQSLMKGSPGYKIPVGRKVLSKMVEQMCQVADTNKRSNHSLRATAATA